MEYLLGGEPRERPLRCADGGPLRRSPREVLLAGSVRRPPHLQPIHLDRQLGRYLSLGAGVFGGRRSELGAELGHGLCQVIDYLTV